MAQSGTVSTGIVYASEYNDLRDDILDASLGHVHTGGTAEGKLLNYNSFADRSISKGVLAADFETSKFVFGLLGLNHRQGGDPEDWVVPATDLVSYNYTPGKTLLQMGSVLWSGAPTYNGTQYVKFGTPYAEAPIVVVQTVSRPDFDVDHIVPSYDGDGGEDVTATGFSCQWCAVQNTDESDYKASNVLFHWIAIGTVA